MFPQEAEGNQPKFTGQATLLDGSDVQLAAWVRRSKAGKKYLRVKISEPYISQVDDDDDDLLDDEEEDQAPKKTRRSENQKRSRLPRSKATDDDDDADDSGEDNIPF